MDTQPHRLYRQALTSILIMLTAAVTYSVWASHNGSSPCPLCIFQRMLFMLIVALAVLGLVLPRAASWAITTGISAVSMGGFAVAAYQCWMQEFPGSVPSCGYADPTLIEQIVDWAGMQSPYFFLATGYCEHKDIAFLGASWAQLAAVAFFTVSLTGAWITCSPIVQRSLSMERVAQGMK